MVGGGRGCTTDLVVNDLAEPLPVAVEHEAVHAHVLVVRDADPLDQAGLVAHGAQRRHEPAVAVAPLADVVRRGAVDVELGVVKDLPHPLDRLRVEIASRPAAPRLPGASSDAVHAQLPGPVLILASGFLPDRRLLFQETTAVRAWPQTRSAPSQLPRVLPSFG